MLLKLLWNGLPQLNHSFTQELRSAVLVWMPQESPGQGLRCGLFGKWESKQEAVREVGSNLLALCCLSGKSYTSFEIHLSTSLWSLPCLSALYFPSCYFYSTLQMVWWLLFRSFCVNISVDPDFFLVLTQFQALGLVVSCISDTQEVLGKPLYFICFYTSSCPQSKRPNVVYGDLDHTMVSDDCV